MTKRILLLIAAFILLSVSVGYAGDEEPIATNPRVDITESHSLYTWPIPVGRFEYLKKNDQLTPTTFIPPGGTVYTRPILAKISGGAMGISGAMTTTFFYGQMDVKGMTSLDGYEFSIPMRKGQANPAVLITNIVTSLSRTTNTNVNDAITATFRTDWYYPPSHYTMLALSESTGSFSVTPLKLHIGVQ